MFDKNRYFFNAFFLLSPAAFAGSLNPPTGPTDPASAMYSIQAICDRLESGTVGNKQTFTEPTSGPTDSPRCTLNDLMDKAPAVDDINGATQAEVLGGKTFWGLQSNHWGPQAGTFSTQIPNNTTVNQPAGNYSAFDLSTVDTDLAASNIKNGVTIFGINGTHVGGGSVVSKTGQMTSYTTGDDGDLKKGLASPNSRFTDNSDGTVTDNLTGLIWLKKANCIKTEYPEFDEDKKHNDGKVTWQHALDFVTGINVGTYANCSASKTDWRLPNIKELHSLIDFSQNNPTLPAEHPFSDVQTNKCYWSSTTYANNNSHAWCVYIKFGNINYLDKSENYSVWPVRGGV